MSYSKEKKIFLNHIQCVFRLLSPRYLFDVADEEAIPIDMELDAVRQSCRMRS